MSERWWPVLGGKGLAGRVGQPFTQIAPEASVSVCPSINDSNEIAYVTPRV